MSAGHHRPLVEIIVQIGHPEADVSVIQPGMRQPGLLAFAKAQDGAPGELQVFRCLFKSERRFE
jgi:hypothetical protein